MVSKNDVLAFFVRSSAAAPPCRSPLLLGFIAITDQPRVGKVRPGCGLQSGAAPVITPIGFRSQAVESAGGGGFAVGPPLMLFLSGPFALVLSGQAAKTGRLHSTVTHHTRNTLHVPGSSYLDLVSLLLLVRKWGLTLPRLICDMPCSSQFV
jgi:hypothetical protein